MLYNGDNMRKERLYEKTICSAFIAGAGPLADGLQQRPGQRSHTDAPVEDKTDPPAGEQSNDSTGGKEDTNADDTGRDAQNTGEGQVGDYAVKITGVRLGKDYDGADAIILDYDFTNNSDETTSAMESLYFQLFQDGVELDFTIITGDDNYDSDSYMKDIRPGVTLSCQCAYVLGNTTSPVEVEVKSISDSFKSKVLYNVDLSALS